MCVTLHRIQHIITIINRFHKNILSMSNNRLKIRNMNIHNTLNMNIRSTPDIRMSNMSKITLSIMNIYIIPSISQQKVMSRNMLNKSIRSHLSGMRFSKVLMS